jgi:hypothetical protein
MWRFVLCALLLTSSAAFAQQSFERLPASCGLTAVSLNGAAGTRTFTCGDDSGKSLEKYSKLLFVYSYTYAATGTITTTCTGGLTTSDATYALTTVTLSSGTATLNWSGVSVTPSLTTNKKWGVVMGKSSWPVIKCVVAHGGTPGVGDVLTVGVFGISE